MANIGFSPDRRSVPVRIPSQRKARVRPAGPIISRDRQLQRVNRASSECLSRSERGMLGYLMRLKTHPPSAAKGSRADLEWRYKRLQREILEISAREQQRIGQDLHDDLCQRL